MFGLVGGEENGHAAMDGADELIGCTGEDRESFQRAIRGVPAVPQAGHAKAFFVGSRKAPRDFSPAVGLPFEKGVGQNKTAALLERIAEGRFFGNRFGPGVDALDTDLGILGPVRDQSPAEFGNFEVGASGPDDGGAVGGSDDRLGNGGDGDLLFADLYLFVFTGKFSAHR